MTPERALEHRYVKHPTQYGICGECGWDIERHLVALDTALVLAQAETAAARQREEEAKGKIARLKADIYDLERRCKSIEDGTRTRTLDWAAKHYGCDAIGPDCPGKCIARCEDIDNLRVTIATLRAENDRLTLAASESARTLQVEIERLREDYVGACQLVAKMHEAAMGRVCGPRRGVVEDVAALQTQVTALREAARAVADSYPWNPHNHQGRTTMYLAIERLQAVLAALS